MIQIYYRPLRALKPLHLALMGAMEVPGTSHDLESRLSLPQMMVQHGIDELVFWKLAELHSSQIVLSSQGKLSLSVWVATEKRGYWQFEDDKTWPLGKGKFSFRPPLALLSDAGHDPETGKVLSVAEAKAHWKSFCQNRAELDKRINDSIITKRLSAAVQASGDLTAIIRDELSKAVTIFQLNQMSKMALKKLSDPLGGNRGSSQASDYDVISKCREEVEKAKNECSRSIKDQESTLKTASGVLLAAWLARRKGLLKSVAEADPCSLLVVSDCGDVSWVEERVVPKSVKVISSTVEQTTVPEESFFSSFGKLIGSLFR